jgi:hypothetical protein
MPELQEINARRKEASGQVSTQTRSLTLGFLAICWALLTAHDEPLKSMAANVNQKLILALTAVSVLVLVCDLLQYRFLTRMVEDAESRAEKSETKAAKYDDCSFAYKAQAFFYHSKFWTLAVGSVLALGVFILLFMPTPSPPPLAQPPVGPCASAPFPTSLPQEDLSPPHGQIPPTATRPANALKK